MPKEMLPVVDKPLIQYAVEEAVAGFTELVFVTGRNKRARLKITSIGFRAGTDLEAKNKVVVDCVRNVLPSHASIASTRASPPRWAWGTPLMRGGAHRGRRTVRRAARRRHDRRARARDRRNGEGVAGIDGSVLALQKIPRANTRQYGMVSGTQQARGVLRLTGMIEKPDPADAPSDMAVVGRYILDPRIFDCLRRTEPGVGGEIQLTDAIAALLRENKVFGYEYEGTRYDCGSKAGFYQATMEIGRKYHGLGDPGA